MRQEFVTRTEFKKHKDVNWRRAHNILAHLKDYIPGWGYSKAEIDAFFEGYDGGKAQVHWNRVTGKPATYPPSAHNHVKADITDTPWAWTDVSKAGSNLTDLVTRNHSSLQNVGNDDHHAKLHASDHQAGGTDGLSVDVPSDIGTSNQAGSQTNFVRRDHVHKHPAGLGTDLHHPQTHTLASHSSKAHSELTGVTADQHHNEIHDVLSASHGDTLADSVVRGDVIIGNATPKWSRLAIGAAAKFLRSNGTDPSWASIVATDLPSHASRHQSGGADAIKLDDLAEPDVNSDLNVSGVRHGLFPKLSGHEAECYAGDGAWLRLYDSTSIVIKILSKISGEARSSNSPERVTDAQSYMKLKETRMDEPTGAMVVEWKLKSSNGETVYAKVYKNGAPLGAEESTTSTDYVTFDRGIDALDVTDLIQIYAYSSDPGTLVSVKDLLFRYDRAITMLGDCALATPLVITTQTPFLMTNQDP